MLHVVLLQFRLDGVEVLAWEVLDHFKLVKLPEINLFVFLDRQDKSLIVHHVVLDYLCLAYKESQMC